MSLVIPDDVVRATRMSAADLQVEIAALLFLDDKLTLGQAAHFAGTSQPEFQAILGRRRIALHYDVQDFREDARTLDELRGK
jgi:predicted HTH domain antitoxin